MSERRTGWQSVRRSLFWQPLDRITYGAVSVWVTAIRGDFVHGARSSGCGRRIGGSVSRRAAERAHAWQFDLRERSGGVKVLPPAPLKFDLRE
jgi:hypothetical protein